MMINWICISGCKVHECGSAWKIRLELHEIVKFFAQAGITEIVELCNLSRPCSLLLGQYKDPAIADIPIEELIEKVDGFVRVFPGRRVGQRREEDPKRPTIAHAMVMTVAAETAVAAASGIGARICVLETAIDPINDVGNESLYYHPGNILLDTEGESNSSSRIILYDERSKTYYWYGEYKDGPTYHAHKKAAAWVSILTVMM
ncbi:hypothetical protein Tco_0534872 [Tanacetum coccineum]